MKLMPTFANVVLRVRKQEQGMIATVKQEDDDFCEVVALGPLVATSGLDIKVGDLVLRPTGLYEWHDEKNDYVYIVVNASDIVALGVEND